MTGVAAAFIFFLLPQITTLEKLLIGSLDFFFTPFAVNNSWLL